MKQLPCIKQCTSIALENYNNVDQLFTKVLPSNEINKAFKHHNIYQVLFLQTDYYLLAMNCVL